MNDLVGADYVARPGDDPPDGVLLSGAGHFPDLPIEVVSAPGKSDTDQLVNDRRDDVLRLERRLGRLLLSEGLGDVDLEVALQRGVLPSHLSSGDVAKIVAFVRASPPERGTSITGVEVLDFDESLATRVLQVSVYRTAELDGPFASIPLGAWIPSDGAWIRGAVAAKAAKYSKPYSETLVLAVDTAMLVHGRQLRAFAEECRSRVFPFKEIWMVPRAGRVMRVYPPADA